jgi:excisionase family DNA binding protein
MSVAFRPFDCQSSTSASIEAPVLRGEPMHNDNRLVLTVAEAAEVLGISRTHAYELVARRELPSLRLGRRIVVPRRGLERLLEGDADGSHAA